MTTIQRALQQQLQTLWATMCCFIVGTVIGTILLWGDTYPFTGSGPVIIQTALISGAIAGAAFVVSTLVYRRGETWPMPRWQRLISNVSSLAVTVALGGVTGLGVLLAGHVMATGLQGLEIGAIGGAVLTGIAAGFAGRLSFQAGINLSLRDLAALLFAFLMIGTVFAMITAADPAWWERNFSQLGAGGAWAFNGTLVIAGLLVATIGSYIGRDLHRLLNDEAISRIVIVVVAWVAAGLALAAVGLLPIDRMPTAHTIAAFAILFLLVGAAGYTHFVLPEPPRVLKMVTALLVVLVTFTVALTFVFSVLSVTVFESMVVGLALLWMTTFIRVLGILTPNISKASKRRRLLLQSRFLSRSASSGPTAHR